MTLTTILLISVTILLVINILFTIAGNKRGNDFSEIKSALLNTERNLKDEFVTNRKENADSLKKCQGRTDQSTEFIHPHIFRYAER